MASMRLMSVRIEGELGHARECKGVSGPSVSLAPPAHSLPTPRRSQPEIVIKAPYPIQMHQFSGSFDQQFQFLDATDQSFDSSYELFLELARSNIPFSEANLLMSYKKSGQL
jgi:hypothetical protein